MSLLQITEPNQSTKPHAHRYALGIDLGTTHSLVAVVRSGQAQVIGNKAQECQLGVATDGKTGIDCQKLLPSVVYFGKENGQDITQVGSFAENMAHIAPAHTIRSIKRFMGRSRADIKFNHPYTLIGEDGFMPSIDTPQGAKNPVEISAVLLNQLYERAKLALPKDSIVGAVITVPAYFDEAQRQATKDAASLIDLPVIRLLNEPTAAAIAYGLDKGEQAYHLIYDLGGGTFDVSLLKLNQGVFEVLATGGNSALGGDDIDRLLGHFLITQSGFDPKSIDNQQKQAINLIAKDCKEKLSHTDSVLAEFSINNKSYQITLNHQILSDIIKPVSERTLSICKQVLQDAKIDQNALDEVILVGGSTRMPIIQELVKNAFGKMPLCRINPDEVVALGASYYANQLINQDHNGVLLIDVTPLSLGLETMGGLTEVIIARNTPIPVTKKQVFTTYQDNQNAMIIHVVQGERDMVADNRSLGTFKLTDIPAMKAGIARIEVCFAIDANGQLTVSATELTTGKRSQIAVKPSYGLSDSEQQKLLKAGFDNAQHDKDQRSLVESIVEAKRELLAVQSALTEFGDLLSQPQQQSLHRAMQNVEKAIDTHEKSKLETAANELKRLSDDFASLIMNQAVKTSLAGTSTNNW